MDLLVLASDDDALAAKVVARLADAPDDLRVVAISEVELSHARRFTHLVADDGCSTEIELRDGRLVRSRDVAAVFNRFAGPWGGGREWTDPDDVDFAAAETAALWLSWLHSLSCPVINPATPRGLAGALRTPLEWLWMAQSAGLPVRRCHWRMSKRPSRSEEDTPPEDSTPVLVIEGIPSTPNLGELGPGLRRLCEASACPVLEIAVVSSREGPIVADISSRPSLADRDSVDAIAHYILDLAAC